MTATERLAEIKARAEVATEGPWDVWEDSTAARLWFARPYPKHRASDGRKDYLSMTKADADFITHARTDVPALVAALEAGLKPLLPHYESPSVRAFGCVCIACEAVEAITEALGADQ